MSAVQQVPDLPSSARDVALRFAEIARMLAAQPSEEATWQAIVQAALAEVTGVEAAAITVVRGDRFQTLAPSSELPPKVDAIQYELRSGPCVDAILEQTVFQTGDLVADRRWPEFGRRAAAEHGVRSMLALRIYLEGDDTIGGLNMYATASDAFDDSSVLAGEILATHAAVALSGAKASNQADHLRQALESNREIGIAMGVLMSRHALTSQQGFDLLRMASQHTHRKLRDIAADVAETGMLDFPPRTSAAVSGSAVNGSPASVLAARTGPVPAAS